ncbi:hypothetical protein [Nonomuraea africana]|uniref:hypothetical protein n=1 Tax=Nonomuraea africana TaxID=46171 RepID=UPI0033F0468B
MIPDWIADMDRPDLPVPMPPDSDSRRFEERSLAGPRRPGMAEQLEHEARVPVGDCVPSGQGGENHGRLDSEILDRISRMTC